MPSVDSVTNVIGKNAPGIKRVYIAALSDILTLPAATAWVVTDDIVMKSGKSFVEFQVSRQAGSTLNVEEAEAEDTTSWVYNLAGFLGGISAAQFNALDKLANNPVLAICEDKNGLMELAGEAGRGLRFKLSQEGGTKSGTRRGVSFEAMMDFGHMPYFYTGTLPMNPGSEMHGFPYPIEMILIS